MCQVNVPDSVCLMKFTEVMALGRKHPVDISKKKYVKYPAMDLWLCFNI